MQPITQFLAAFPSNLLFPLVVYAIVRWRLNADVWLSPLMILGAQWYILFNVIAGSTVFPNDLREAARSFGVRGWRWWRKIAIPAVFPAYVTGALTASGGAWNAAIVAEVASWGDQRLEAHGLGAYIADASARGDFRAVTLGVAVMAVFVVLLNRYFWRPLFAFGRRKLGLD
jgi:NitT/TauT family transport system permease protein